MPKNRLRDGLICFFPRSAARNQTTSSTIPLIPRSHRRDQAFKKPSTPESSSRPSSNTTVNRGLRGLNEEEEETPSSTRPPSAGSSGRGVASSSKPPSAGSSGRGAASSSSKPHHLPSLQASVQTVIRSNAGKPTSSPSSSRAADEVIVDATVDAILPSTLPSLQSRVISSSSSSKELHHQASLPTPTTPKDPSTSRGVCRAGTIDVDSVTALVEAEEARLKKERDTPKDWPHGSSTTTTMPSSQSGSLYSGSAPDHQPSSQQPGSASKSRTGQREPSASRGRRCAGQDEEAARSSSQQQHQPQLPHSISATSHHYHGREGISHSSSREGGRSSSSSMGGSQVSTGIVRAASAWLQRKINLRPQLRGVHLITDELLKQIPEMNEFLIGLLHIQVLHTSCSLALNEVFAKFLLHVRHFDCVCPLFVAHL